MAKTIKEMMQKAFWETDISDHPAKAFEQGYEAGANAVLEEIEAYLNNLNLGNSTEEKFYKLDVIADVGLYIKQLKGE